MKRLAMLFGWLALASAAQAQETQPAPPPGCALASDLIVSQGQGTVTINCSGVTEGYGDQLADLLSQILQNRLDPQAVIAKLDEIERVPEDGKPRTVDDAQRQAIIQALLGKPVQEIGIAAHSQVDDSAEYARALAQPLLMVGWQIQGQQIKRSAPKALDDVRGVALLVRSRDQPPAKALLLRSALTTAHVVAPLLSDPTMPADAVVMWIGRRPVFMSADQKPQ